MTEVDIIALVTGFSGVAVVTASEANGAPEVAWGDTFFFYDPENDTPDDRRMPFATIVTDDYPEFDTLSNLGRQGVFRLNVSVDRPVFQEVIGYPATEHAEHTTACDYAALDRLLPHPIYAAQAWASVLNPGEATDALVRSLLAHAHTRAAGRRQRGR